MSYLASILHFSPKEIEYLVNNIDDYYGKWVEEKKDKATGKVKTYPDGTPKQRTIRPSYGRLKQIQKSIKINILTKIVLPHNVHGGVKGKSNISNAKTHQGNKYQFATDLQNFFPGITHNQIYQAFIKLGSSTPIAHWLTKLTSIEFELPQGTPTSTAIANLVFLDVDYQLIKLCKINNITYSRYVDDLTFSSPTDFRHLTGKIIEIIKSGGFNINYRKTKYKGNQTLTGIIVFNNYIDAPDKIKAAADAELMIADCTHRPYNNYLRHIRSTNY